jgi:type IV secretion system protein VirB10
MSETIHSLAAEAADPDELAPALAEEDQTPTPEPASRFVADPESLALRAAPAAIVRFRKGMLIGAAATVFVALAGVSWIALSPAGLRLAATEPELSPAQADSAPEVLGRLPVGYSANTVPELGPPLPGDLGRPILAHQREMADESAGSSSPSGSADPAAEMAAADRERRMAEVVQARGAPILMQVSRPGAPDLLAGSAARAERTSQDGPDADSFTNPSRLRPPLSRWQVAAGSTIAASLITGLNSDLPGMVVAQVTEPVFDSATGRTVLVPQGARLLGRYESKVPFGQRRALLVWERLIMPDGSSIGLDNAPATDAAGFAGVADRVDFHTWQLLKGIGFSTLLGVGSELTFGEREGDLLRALRESMQSNADRAGQKIVERNLDIAPTITVRPGLAVRVLVHKDLVLPPWKG